MCRRCLRLLCLTGTHCTPHPGGPVRTADIRDAKIDETTAFCALGHGHCLEMGGGGSEAGCGRPRRTEVWGQQKRQTTPATTSATPTCQLLGTADAQSAPATTGTAPAHQPNGLRERGNDTSGSTGRSGRRTAATRRNMRREERVTVHGPVKEQQPDGMSHMGGGRGVQGSGGVGWGVPPPPPPWDKAGKAASSAFWHISHDELIQLVQFSLTEDNYVLCAGQLWQRTDAIPMGGSFSAECADLHSVWALKEAVSVMRKFGDLVQTVPVPLWKTPAGNTVSLSQFRDNVNVACAGPSAAMEMSRVCTALSECWVCQCYAIVSAKVCSAQEPA